MAAPRQVRRSTQAERWSLGNSQRSARLGLARLGSARLGSARLSSAQLSSAQLSSAQLSSAQLSSAQLSSAQLSSELSSAQLSSAQLSSAQLSSAQLSSAQLSSAQLSSAQLSSAQNSRVSTCVECQVFFRVIHTCSRSVPFRPGHRPRRRTHQEKWRALERSADRIASDARVVSELAGRRAWMGTRCHGSLLRHASRAIVTSRPLRAARDRQLRQTVPGSRETGRVLHALPRHPVTTRSGEFGRKKAESGREPGRPEDATAWRFTRTR